MDILHLVSWYPNRWNENEALFIKEHYCAVLGCGSNQLWHVHVKNAACLFRYHTGKYSDTSRYLIVETCLNPWQIQEVLTLCMLIFLRLRLGRKSWNIVSVHIAYPLLRFPRIFKFLFGRNVVIAEHWSAYHQGFHLPEGSKARHRIQNIFRQGMPVIAVSRALMNDIIRFAETANFPQFVVPNVVDPRVFYVGEQAKNEADLIFLMVGSWAPIKRPLLVMEAFAEIAREYPSARLRIVGYGQQWAAMESFVKENGLENQVALLGALPKTSIAEEMRQASALVHASNYETFSVVCAEALCCGLPVIASSVGGIPEFVDKTNGILVENVRDAWVTALKSFISKQEAWDRRQISERATSMFSPEVVGKMLSEIYAQCCEGQRG